MLVVRLTLYEASSNQPLGPQINHQTVKDSKFAAGTSELHVGVTLTLPDMKTFELKHLSVLVHLSLQRSYSYYPYHSCCS